MVNRCSTVMAARRGSTGPRAVAGSRSVTGWWTLSMYPLSIAMPISSDVMLLVTDASSCGRIRRVGIERGVEEELSPANHHESMER